MLPLNYIFKEWDEEEKRNKALNDSYWAEYKAMVKTCPHCGEHPSLVAYSDDKFGPYAAIVCCSKVEHYGGSVDASVYKAFYRWNQRI
jgi:hypothetical protein